MKPFETARLLLRPWLASDFEPLATYFADPGLAKYVGGVKTKEEAWRLLASYIGHWQLKGYGYWAVEEKSSQQFVGGVGLWHSPNWPELELGYWIMPQMQGKGYATEAARRAQRFAFEALASPSLVSYIDPANESSKRVAERVGGAFEAIIELLDFGPHEVYRYTKKGSI